MVSVPDWGGSLSVGQVLFHTCSKPREQGPHYQGQLQELRPVVGFTGLYTRQTMPAQQAESNSKPPNTDGTILLR